MHPADIEAYKKIMSKGLKFIQGKSEEELNSYSINFNYRLEERKGVYINLLQQVIYLSIDKKGNVVYEAGFVIDISRYNNDGNISLLIAGTDGKPLKGRRMA